MESTCRNWQTLIYMVLYYKVQEKGNDMNVWVVTFFNEDYNETAIIGVFSSIFKAYKAILEDCSLSGEIIAPQKQYWNNFDAKEFWVEIDHDYVRYEIQRTKIDE